MTNYLHNTDYHIQLKQGESSRINALGTTNAAVQGEPHYTTDSKMLYIFDGSVNLPAGVVEVNTAANIIARSATQGQIAYASDENRLYVADGTNWRFLNLTMTSSAPNMGVGDHSASGYFDDMLTDKRLANVYLGDNVLEVNGAIRVDVGNDPDTLEIYLRGSWQAIIYDLTTEFGDFRHTPLGEEIQVWTGHSVTKDLAGQPLIQEYRVSMGAYSVPRLIDLGDF